MSWKDSHHHRPHEVTVPKPDVPPLKKAHASSLWIEGRRKVEQLTQSTHGHWQTGRHVPPPNGLLWLDLHVFYPPHFFDLLTMSCFLEFL